MKSVGFLSAVIYTVMALVVTGLFLAGTAASKYAPIERFGGAVWVFLLSMIILMPIVTPLVRRKLGG